LHFVHGSHSPARVEDSRSQPYLCRLNTQDDGTQAMLTTLINAITRQVARSRAIRTLNRLDDRRLRDLGIARDQIELFVDGRI